MTDLLQRKQAILDYIIRYLDERNFNRRLEHYRRQHGQGYGADANVNGFRDFRSFENFQVTMVNQADENTLPTLEFFRDYLIPRARSNGSQYHLLDKGFAFTSNGDFAFNVIEDAL